MIILDSNVISALMRPDLHSQVVAWLDGQPRSSIWITSVTVLEIRSGILLLPEGRRRSELNAGFGLLLSASLEGRVLPFDLQAAEQAARIVAYRVPQGRNIGTRDTQIAAITMAHGATLATRNVKDFSDLELSLFDPWMA